MSSTHTEKYIDEKRREKSFLFSEVPFDQSKLRISTDRYTSREFQERERDMIWMRVWQVAGRADELPVAGDWKEYLIFDQSYIIVRGTDQKLRGFANVCPHRGNTLCVGGSGHSTVLVCPFHRWTFELDGRLRGITRPDLVGPINTDELGLPEVSVDSFAGFIFLNPDPHAKPLAEFLGKDVIDWLAPYHLEDMIPVGMDVRETLNCNWKIVIDAFQEGYHIQGLHPQMGDVIRIDPAKSRMNFIGDHHLSVAPFEVANVEGFTPEQEVEGIRTRLPATYHGAAEIVPLFDELVGTYRNKDGKLEFPGGVTAHTLLQKATRMTLTRKGLDVSGLSDEQMTDHFGWLLFPNFFFSVRAGEGTLIAPVPHPDGDPNKCIWHVTRYAWLPPGLRGANRAKLVDVDKPGSYPYFLVLQQDYESMPRQQKGLRNSRLKYMTVGQEESLIAKFHLEVDKYVEGKAKS
jgi:nitrite reductase/ring-hydroxylating ferredoxin subunit